MRAVDRRRVYLYKMADSSEFRGIACDCHIYQDGDRKGLRYLVPPERGHSIEGTVTEDTDAGFTFRSEGYAPGDWAFKVLTIEDFRRKYHRLVIDGDVLAGVIKTTEDLHEWYRKEFGFGW